MEEWKEYKLGEICTKIGSGATPKGGKESYLGGGISLIRSQNVLDFTFSLDGLAFINDEQASKLDGVEIYKGDVLLNITGDSVARCCIVPDSVLPARVNQHVSIVRGDKTKVLNEYILYYLQYKKQLLLSLSQGGATRNALTKGMIEEFRILLPSIDEQSKIVSILKSLDDKIENNRKRNENLGQQAQALFKSWFVDFEPFRDQPFVESELGMIPEGWRVEELGKLIETTSGGTPSRKIDNYYNNGSIYWVKSKELLDNFIINSEEKITDVAIKESSAKLLPSHSVLIAMYGATVGAIGITTKPMACNQAICALLPNQLLPYTFLYLFAKFSKIYLQNKAVGSAQQNISQIIIKSLKVSYNSNAIKRFNSIVEPLLTIIEKNAFESHRLSLLRDTLLPKLMSGEITL